jgi:hypothetical protein
MKGKIALALAALIAGGMFGAREPAAAATLVTHRIPAALALEAVGEAVAACAKQGYAETAVLVDADGVRQALLRGDASGVHSLGRGSIRWIAPSARPTPAPRSRPIRSS